MTDLARRALAGLAASLMLAGVARAETPALTNVRYNEDWSVLADPAARTGRWTEAFKYIPFDDEGRAYLTTGLELRLRNEDFRDNLWGSADAPDDGYGLARALPYADLHLGRVRAFVQPVVAYAASVAPAAGPVDETGVDLLQGFVEVRHPLGESSLTLRAGRQMLSLGTERLVGTRYGPNVPLAFDGVRADFKVGAGVISLLKVKPVSPRPGDFDDRASRTKSLSGAYAALPGLDLYYLDYRNRAAVFGGLRGEEHRHSLGVRGFGKIDAWSWNIEGVLQGGTFGQQKIRAWTLGSEVARRFDAEPLSPRARVRFNIVSGDTDHGDRKLGTFNALFPKGKYFGELSPIGPYNIVSLNPEVSFDLGKQVTLGLAGMAYWRYARADGIYDVPGNLIRAAGDADSRFIGKQAEVVLDWQATPELDLSTSLSAFAPGGFIRETGPARTIGMLGLEANFRF